MNKDKEWSLKERCITIINNSIYNCYAQCIGELHEERCNLYLREDIETLREKLIEDIKKVDKETHWLYGHFSKGLIKIINKRFGVDE